MTLPNPFSQKRMERERLAEYIGMGLLMLFFMAGAATSLWFFVGLVIFDREIGDELTYLAVVMFPLTFVIMVWDKRISRENALRDQLAQAYALVDHLIGKEQGMKADEQSTEAPNKAGHEPHDQ